jgi:uncharacterized protein (TIGR03437 family)
MKRGSASALIGLACLLGWINPSGRYAYAQYDYCTMSCAATGPGTAAAGSTVQFNVAVQTYYCTGLPSYSWSFGDGRTSSQQNPSHTYQAAGTYNWSVRVAINEVSDTQSGTVTINSSSVTSVSAASYDGSGLASESIAVAFGSNLATLTQSAATIPLPTEIAGTRVLIKDAAGAQHSAPLFFVSPGQINFHIPRGTAAGEATVTVMSGTEQAALGKVQIAAVAPGLFSATSNGRGFAAATVLRVKGDGTQIFEPVVRFDQALAQFVATPIDLGPETDQVFLVLFGTGLRYRSTLSGVSAKISDLDAQVLYAGPQDGFVGLDQVNLRLLRNLAGRGEVNITLTVDGKTTNVVTINIK